ncbi:molybdenum cofactor guanylyltransferase [Micrococcoides hystricis]|uniref:Molybdenum cofactor guanylyltransferase n=1 Tax=Micrococcoides hystricis TaxID=1572761 RepID=A0ABV6PBU1_9MICC
MTYLAIILTGGRGSRLGNRRKDHISIGGRTLAQAAVDATDRAAGRVMVGPPTELMTRSGAAPIQHVWERPQYAGPAAAIAAGWEKLTAGADLGKNPLGHASVEASALPVLLLGVDLPRLEELVPALLQEWHNAPPGTKLVLPQDESGRDQNMAAVISAEALGNILAAKPFIGLVDASMRELFDAIEAGSVHRPVLAPALLMDIDTPADARAAKAKLPDKEA